MIRYTSELEPCWLHLISPLLADCWRVCAQVNAGLPGALTACFLASSELDKALATGKNIPSIGPYKEATRRVPQVARLGEPLPVLAVQLQDWKGGKVGLDWEAGLEEVGWGELGVREKVCVQEVGEDEGQRDRRYTSFTRWIWACCPHVMLFA